MVPKKEKDDTPGVHCSQSPSASLPVVLLNVPGGHNSGVPVPMGQYEPVGQISPVTPSVGADTEAPLVQ